MENHDEGRSTATMDLGNVSRPYKEVHRFWSRGDRFGRYEVQAQVGEGSMGRVYRAVDPLAMREVAIKTLRSEYMTEETTEAYRRRFVREAQAAGGLAHPNVVRIYDGGEDFLVMELLEGEPLGAMLRRRGALPVDSALRILRSVAGALDHAHARGIVHRDVKPGNIMMCSDGEPKLMDFGLAVMDGEELSVDDKFLGTPAYMAPEQIARGDASLRSDLFSLAVVAYEMLTGQRPFQGADLGAITWNVVHEPAPAITSIANLPPAFDAVFDRALAKNPLERFDMAADFARALEMATRALRDQHTTDVAGVAARLRHSLPDAVLHVAIDGCVLEVGSDPVGALVLIDGRRVGTTPLALTQMPSGEHTLRVIHAGYAPVQMSFVADAGRAPSALHFTLYPMDVHGIAAAPAASVFPGLADAMFEPRFES
jgi:serine/threonine protein kinase